MKSNVKAVVKNSLIKPPCGAHCLTKPMIWNKVRVFSCSVKPTAPLQSS